jgi:hypothetical protein
LLEVTDLKLRPTGELSFIVPGRELFYERPGTLQQVKAKQLRSAGFTRDVLHMTGRLQAGILTLNCTSSSSSCPENMMPFRKGP